MDADPRQNRTRPTLQNAIFRSENFSNIATDEKGVIQLFNVGAERRRRSWSAQPIF
jgi:hypothetical protein